VILSTISYQKGLEAVYKTEYDNLSYSVKSKSHADVISTFNQVHLFLGIL
jgi:hypothetical protein